MNIYDLSRKSGISIKKLRGLVKMKVLTVDEENAEAAKIRYHLARNPQLTVDQTLMLFENQDLIFDLERYSARAQEQIDVLGEVMASVAPKDVTAAIHDASRGDEKAALIIAEWIKAVIPAHDVHHHWIAVRLLVPLNEFLRQQNAPLINLALMHVRKLPDFAGWWRSKESNSRNSIVYHQKPKITLDL